MITSASFVLAATFAVLATIPLTALTEIGFTVAFGILLDTIVVRSVLVTALNLDVGHRMWWPSKAGAQTRPGTRRTPRRARHSPDRQLTRLPPDRMRVKGPRRRACLVVPCG